MIRYLFVSLSLGCAAIAAAADGVDAKGAEALMKRSGCVVCHAVDRAKIGPAYRDVAAKYRDQSAAVEKLFAHLTAHPVVKINGSDARHSSLNTKKDDDVRNVVRWILAQ